MSSSRSRKSSLLLSSLSSCSLLYYYWCCFFATFFSTYSPSKDPNLPNAPAAADLCYFKETSCTPLSRSSYSSSDCCALWLIPSEEGAKEFPSNTTTSSSSLIDESLPSTSSTGCWLLSSSGFSAIMIRRTAFNLTWTSCRSSSLNSVSSLLWMIVSRTPMILRTLSISLSFFKSTSWSFSSPSSASSPSAGTNYSWRWCTADASSSGCSPPRSTKTQ